MATLRDVARIAGVSKMTVSNVLNGKNAQVSEETRVRVLAADMLLGQIANGTAVERKILCPQLRIRESVAAPAQVP